MLASEPLEQLVNTLVPRLQTSEQQSTAIEIAPNGDTLVVFNGRGPTDNDGIFFRRIPEDGAASTDRRVNTTITGAQQRPNLAVYADGNYVITWDGRGPGDQQGVFARWYDVNDQPLTGEILINQVTPGYQGNSDVSVGSDGNTIIVWEGTSGSAEPEGIFRRWFDANGTAISNQHRINATTSGTQNSPAVVLGPENQAIVTWSSHDLANGRWSTRFDILHETPFVTGEERLPAARNERLVSAETASSQQQSRVGVDDMGRFLVSWSGFSPETDSWNIYKRHFANDGTPLSAADQLVHSQRGGIQKDPDLAMAEDGRYAISWTSGIPDGSGWEVYAKFFGSGGASSSGEFIVSEQAGENSGHQNYSAIALGSGPLQVIWSGSGAIDRRGVWLRRSLLAQRPSINPVPPQTIDELTPISLQITTVSNNSEQQIRYGLEPFSHPAGMVIHPVTGMLTWTPSELDGPGVFTPVVIAADADDPQLADRLPIQINVREVNLRPQLMQPVDVTIDEGSRYEIRLLAADQDLPENQLTFSLLESPSPRLQLDSVTGVLNWPTNELDGPGSYQIRVQVTDNGVPSLHSTTSWTVHVREVNQAPHLEPIPDQQIPEEQAWQFAVSAFDDDQPVAATGLSFSLDNAAKTAGITIDNEGLIEWTPNEQQGPGSFPVTVTVRDADGAESQRNFTVHVTEVNQAPQLAAIANQATTIGQEVRWVNIASDTDLPENSLNYSIDPAALGLGAQINPTSGEFTWTPVAAGAFSFRITVTDNGTPPLHDSRSVLITVDTAFRPPQLQPLPELTIPEHDLLEVTIAATPGGENREVRYRLSDEFPTHANLDAITGEFTWRPSERDGPGRFVIPIEAFDPAAPELIDSDRLIINVSEVNQAPTISVPNAITINEGDSLRVMATASDEDFPANNLRFRFADATAIPAGMHIDPQTGVIEWQTDEGSGPLMTPISVQVVDNGSPPLHDTGTFMLTVREVNRPPTIQPIADVTIDEMLGWQLAVTATDPDLPADTLFFELDEEAVAAGLRIDSQGLIRWTPDEQQGPGTYPVTVTVSDDAMNALRTSSTFNVLVNEVNRPPNLQPINDFAVRPGESVSFTAQASDPDLPANQLSYSLAGEVPPGATLDSQTGSFHWTSNSLAEPTFYSFWINVSDNGAPPLSATQPVAIEVLPEILLLTEDDRFVTAYEQRFELLPNRNRLRLRFTDLSFDNHDADSINDAFEIALVDDRGIPLAPIISPNRDSLFNHTEDEVVLLGAGTFVSHEGATTIIEIDVSHLQAGMPLRLIQRLVNNDEDNQTRVTLFPGVEQISGPANLRIPPANPAEFAPSPVAAQSTVTASDWRHLTDATSAVALAYDHTTYDIDSQVVAAGVTITNNGLYPLRGPLLFTVSETDKLAVTPIDYTNVTPRGQTHVSDLFPPSLLGAPYYDITALTNNGDLQPGEAVRFMLQFRNPTNERFDYRGSLLATINRAPGFVTDPPLSVRLNNPYTYFSSAIDPEDDRLNYQLQAGPVGMSIDAESGQLQWTPGPEATGRHVIVITATDPFGLSARQTYQLHVVDDHPLANQPPTFITAPVVDAYANQQYVYRPLAADPDFDALTYDVVIAPDGFQMPTENAGPSHEASLVTWTPTVADVGRTFNVTLRANDDRGGEAWQDYTIRVHPLADNLPPLIVSTPETEFLLPIFQLPEAVGNVAPEEVIELLAVGQSTTFPASVTLPPDTLLTTADVVFVIDESGSMREQGWMQELIPALDAALIEKGIGNNQYALVGYGSFSEIPRIVTETLDFEVILYGSSGVAIDRQVVRAGTPIEPIPLPTDDDYQLAVTRYRPLPSEPSEASLDPTADLDFQFIATREENSPINRENWGHHSGTLTEGQTEIEFIASAGDMLMIDGVLGDGVSAKLRDPNGNVVAAEFSLLDDFSPTLLRHSGSYQLQLTGITATPFSLQLLSPLLDGSSLSLGQTVESSLATSEHVSVYTFNADEANQLFLDRLRPASGSLLTNSTANFDLTLVGPEGVVAESRIRTDLFGAAPLDLPYDLGAVPLTQSGDYAIIVSTSELATHSTATSYSFQLSNLVTSSIPLSLDSPFSDELENAAEANSYELILSGNSLLSVQLETPQHAAASWTLLDPTGLPISSGELTNGLIIDAQPIRSSGEHRLLVQAHANNLETVEFELLASATPGNIDAYSGLPFELNTAVTGSFGETDRQDYTISLQAGHVVFPTLVEPHGDTVGWRILAPSGGILFEETGGDDLLPGTKVDGDELPNPRRLIAPETGLYQVQILQQSLAEAFTFAIAGVEHDLVWQAKTTGQTTPSGSLEVYRFTGQAGHSLELRSHDDEALFGSAEIASERANYLRAIGDVEDGYWGINHALEHLPFRTHASRQIILLTDESRDPVRLDLTKAQIKSQLEQASAALHVVAKAELSPTDEQLTPNALGVNISPEVPVSQDSFTFFYPDGDGTFHASVGNGLRIDNAEETTREDYVDLAVELDGSAWNIEYLREPGTAGELQRSSFTSALVSTLTNEIARQAVVDLVVTPDDAPISVGEPTFSDQTVTFPVTLLGDGDAWNFDLNFIDANLPGVTYGSIPGAIAAAYQYRVRAIDPEGDPITYGLPGAETLGASFDAKAQQMYWAPTEPGQYSFMSTAADPLGGVDEQHWTVSVSQSVIANTPPTLLEVDLLETEIDRPLRQRLEAFDANGDRVTFSLIPEPNNGHLPPLGMTLDPYSGQLDWTPNREQIGLHRVHVMALDGRGGRDFTELSIQVTPPRTHENSSPKIESTPMRAAVIDLPYRYQVIANDADGDPLTYSLAWGPNGMMIDPETGMLGWAPTAEQSGNHQIIIRVEDNQGGLVLQDYVLTAVASNIPPVINSTPQLVTGLNLPWTYRPTALDANGDLAQFSLATDQPNPSGAEFDNSFNIIRWTPTDVGVYQFNLLADDYRGGRTSHVFEVTVLAEAPPVFLHKVDVVSRIGESVEAIILLGGGIQPSDLTLSVSEQASSQGVQISRITCPTEHETCATAFKLRWLPESLGDFSFPLIARHTNGLQSTSTARIQVVSENANSNPPKFNSTPTGPAVVGIPWLYQVRANDPEGTRITYSLSGASPAGMSIDAATGLITWLPNHPAEPQEITVVASDASAVSSAHTFMLAAVERHDNLAPRFNTIPLTQIRIGTNWQYASRAIDAEGDRISYALNDAAITAGIAVDQTTGLVTWTPHHLQTVEVVLTATDALGAASSQLLPLEVKPAKNSPPRITSTALGPAIVGQSWSYHPTAFDADGDHLYFSIESSETYPGLEIDHRTGRVTYQSLQFNVLDFEIVVNDSKGGVAKERVQLDVIERPFQDLSGSPQITSKPAGIARLDQPWTYQVTAIDPNSQALTYELNTEAIDRGVLIDTTTGRLTWTPTSLTSQRVTITVINAADKSTQQTFTLRVQRSNRSPQFLSAPSGAIWQDQRWEYPLRVQDPDGHAVTLSLDDASVELGTAISEEGILSWTPDQLMNTQVQVTAEDEYGLNAIQSFALNVIPAHASTNNPPRFISKPPISAGLLEPYTYRAAAISADAILSPQSPMHYHIDRGPIGMTINASSGDISWTPRRLGSVEIEIVATDFADRQSRQIVRLEVVPTVRKNQPPLFLSTPLGPAARDLPYEYPLRVVDHDGDRLTYTLTGEAAELGMRIDADGVLRWLPTDAGRYTVAVQVVDSLGGIASQEFTLVVLENAPPRITSLPPTRIASGEELTHTVTAIDPNGETLLFQLEEGPLGALLNPSTGDLTWLPEKTGGHSFIISVSDQNGGYERQAFDLQVFDPNLNQPPFIIGQPRNKIQFGVEYRYQITAVDQEHDSIIFSLSSGPAGLTVTPHGQLQWSPTADQLTDTAGHPVRVLASDSRGASSEAEWMIRVGATAENEPPVIRGTPQASAIAGRVYQTALDALDPDGDTVYWSLTGPPAGMTIGDNGVLQWTPTLDEIGTHTFTATAMDQSGASNSIGFQISVRGNNSPAQLSGNPSTHHRVDTHYKATFHFSDPDNDDVELRFLTGFPSHGATLDTSSGVMNWLPTELGEYQFTINARDSFGEGTTIRFSLTIDETGPNDPPEFLDTEPGIAEAGLPYARVFLASDPEQDTLTYSLITGPENATFDDAGLLSWDVPLELLDQTVEVVLQASDIAGNQAQYHFQLSVREANEPPEIISEPLDEIVAGQFYQYNFAATDPNQDQLDYQLVAGPAGMQVDAATGRVEWTSTAADTGEQIISLAVTDGRISEPITQSFTLRVAADTEPPTVHVATDRLLVEPNESIVFLLSAFDNVAVTDRTLFIADEPLATDAQGYAVYRFSAPGHYTIRGEAEDAAENTASTEIDVIVRDPNDQPVEIFFTNVAENASFTEPSTIRATISDPENQLSSIRLFLTTSDGSFAPRLLAEYQASGGDFLPPFQDGEIGTLDPTLLSNGSYQLILEATDAGEGLSTKKVPIQIDGTLKLGSYQFVATDLQIPLVGMPLAIRRVYNSLDADRPGDFGVGWNLDVGVTKISIDPQTLGGVGQGKYQSFIDGTRLHVVLPDGRSEGFTFAPDPIPGFTGHPPIYQPRFIPDPGNETSLSGPDELIRFIAGQYVTESNVAYHPADPELGNFYELKHGNRSVRRITASSGKTESIQDRNGIKITFEEDRFVSNTGVSIEIERDYRNRIVAIVDPRGNRVTYDYNIQDQLIAVTDRFNNTRPIEQRKSTVLSYTQEGPPRLQKVVDADGIQQFAGQIDLNGRLITQLDPFGNQVSQAVDSTARTRNTVVGGVSLAETTYDSRGQLATITDFTGSRTEFTFSAAGKPEQITRNLYDEATGELAEQFVYAMELDDAGRVLSRTAPDGQTSRYIYDPFTGEFIAEIDPLGNRTSYELDERGNLLSITKPDQQMIRYTRDEYGNALSAHLVDLSAGSAGDCEDSPLSTSICYAERVLFETEFDDQGRQVRHTDSFGNHTTTTYDANNNVVLTAVTSPSDNSGKVVTTWNHDANDRPQGRQVQLISSTGITQKSTQIARNFDNSGRLLNEASSDGESTSSQFNAAGRPVIMESLGANGETQLIYQIFNHQGQPEIVTNPVPSGQLPNTAKRFHYDLTGQVIRTDALVGLQLSIEEVAGRPHVTLIEAGQIIAGATAEPDGINHPELIATEDGRSIMRVRDYLGRTIEATTTVRGDDGSSIVRRTRTAYDEFGRVLTATDPFDGEHSGPITGVRYTYDSLDQQLRSDRVSGLLIEIVTRDDGTQAAEVVEPGQLLDNDRWDFDDAGRVILRRETDGSTVAMAYDGRGRLVSQTTTVVSDTEPVLISLTVYEDARDDNLLSIVQLAPVTAAELGTAAVRATRTVRDQANRVHLVEFLTNVIATVEELAGGRVQTSLVTAGQVVGRETTLYDSLGRVVRSTNASGGHRDYSYDQLGNTISVTEEAYFDVDLGLTVRPRTEFNFEGRRRIATTAGVRVLPSGEINRAEQRVVSFGYDDAGRANTTIFPDGSSERIQHNALNQLIAEIDAAGRETLYEYNSEGALNAVILPLISADDTSLGSYHPRTEFEYDDWGNRIVTRSGVIQRTDGTLDYSQAREARDYYDAAGDLIASQRPKGLREQREYDAQARIKRIIRPDQSIESFVWSEDPLDPGLIQTEYFQDAASYAAGEPTDWTRADTDIRGNVTQDFAAGEIHRKFDGSQRLVSLTTPGGEIRYEYNALGQLRSAATFARNDPEQLQGRVEYTYDQSARLASVTLTHSDGSSLSPVAGYQYAYDVFGRIRRILHPDGTIELYDYDLLGRTAQIRYLVEDSTPQTWEDNLVLASFEYHFDPAGNRERVVETFGDPLGQPIEVREIELRHDAADRLVEYVVTDNLGVSVTTYDYDAAHNRTQQGIDQDADGIVDLAIAYEYDLADRILAETHWIDGVESLNKQYEYRPGATAIHKVTSRDAATDLVLSETEFTYDLRGYLIGEWERTHGGVEISRSRDLVRGPHGELMEQREVVWEANEIVHEQTLQMIVDPLSPSGHSQLFEARDLATGATERQIVTGHRVLAESDSTSTLHSLWSDVVGSTRVKKPLSEELNAVTHYGAFGTPTSDLTTLHGYAGEIQNPSSGRVFLRQRTYQPQLGRFLQADSFSGIAMEPTSLNRYIYSSNAPLTYRDPSGNLFVLIDGTWNHDRVEFLEEGEDFSNIKQLRDAFLTIGSPSDIIYRRGVGNPVDNNIFGSMLGGGFGMGLLDIIATAISRTVTALTDMSDEIYLSGFSRGGVASIQYAHELKRTLPAARIRMMAIYDPVGSISFPGNGINPGFNLSLAGNVMEAESLIAWQEDRGFFPGVNLHSRRAKQRVTYGLHSDVGGGYGTAPLQLIQDALFQFHDIHTNAGLALDPVGVPCPLCDGDDSHYPHSADTYLKQGGKTMGELGRPMVEHPMPGELGLAFFAEAMDLRRVGITRAEANAVMANWIPAKMDEFHSHADLVSDIPIVQYLGPVYVAWNLAALHASHIHFWVNRI
ncbi:putative Ig domain-containing protein [Planctomycetaceae bacterium SH139]